MASYLYRVYLVLLADPGDEIYEHQHRKYRYLLLWDVQVFEYHDRPGVSCDFRRGYE